MKLQERILHGSLAGGASLVVNLTLTLAQVPVLLYFWGSKTYGLWLTLLSVLSLVSIFDLGHQNYVGVLFNRYFVESPDHLKKVLASSLLIAGCLALIELIVGSLVVFLVPMTSLLGDSAADIGAQLRGASLVYLVYCMLLGSAMGVFARLYNPKGLYARATIWATIMRVSQFMGLTLAAIKSQSLLHAMIFYCVAGGVVNVALMLDIRRNFRDLLPSWSDVSVSTGLKNFGMSLWLTVNNFLDQASSNGLTVLVARLLGVDAVPVLATLRTVTNVVTQGATILVSPLAPEFARYYYRRELPKLTAVLSTTWALGSSLVNMAILLLIVIAPSLYAWWTQGHIAFDTVLFRYLCLAVCVRCSVLGSDLFLVSINHLQAQLVISVARGLTVCLVFIATVKWLGVSAAGLALLLSEVVACLGLLTCFTRNEIQKLEGHFPWRSIMFSMVSLSVVAGILWLAEPGFIIVGAGFAVLYSISWAMWRNLPEVVHVRLLSLVRGFVRWPA